MFSLRLKLFFDLIFFLRLLFDFFQRLFRLLAISHNEPPNHTEQRAENTKQVGQPHPGILYAE